MSERTQTPALSRDHMQALWSVLTFAKPYCWPTGRSIWERAQEAIEMLEKGAGLPEEERLR